MLWGSDEFFLEVIVVLQPRLDGPEFLGDEKNEWFKIVFGNDKITDGLDSSRTSRTDMIHDDTQRPRGVDRSPLEI